MIISVLDKDHHVEKNMFQSTFLLFAEEALREERFFFLDGRGEEGSEMEAGGREAEMAEESGETERLLVGLLLGEPRGEEYGDRAWSMRPLRSWMAC